MSCDSVVQDVSNILASSRQESREMAVSPTSILCYKLKNMMTVKKITRDCGYLHSFCHCRTFGVGWGTYTIFEYLTWVIGKPQFHIKRIGIHFTLLFSVNYEFSVNIFPNYTSDRNRCWIVLNNK